MWWVSESRIARASRPGIAAVESGVAANLASGATNGM